MTDDIQARIAQRMHRQEQEDQDAQRLRRQQHYDSLARVVEQRGDETVAEMEVVRDCVACGNKGRKPAKWIDDAYPSAALAEVIDCGEPCPHCHGRGWLKATSWEPPCLFSVRTMATADGTRWGVMREGSGRDEETWWHPERFRSLAAAEAKRDLLLCLWCEGMETLLADNFSSLRDEEQRRALAAELERLAESPALEP